MGRTRALPAEALYQKCCPEQFDFDTTDDLERLPIPVVGQKRAIDSIEFSIGMKSSGYNLFALGPPGAHKHSVIEEYLKKHAADQPTPSDWCYANNFKQRHKPRVIVLPPGMGEKLRKDLEQLVEELGTTIPAVFETDDYRTRKQELEEEFQEQHEQVLASIQKRANKRDVALIRTPAGLAFAPLRDGDVLPPEEFRKLSEADRNKVEEDVADLQQELQRTLRMVPRWRREVLHKIKNLDQEVTKAAVSHAIDELKKKYAQQEAVVTLLEDFQQDVVENAEDFIDDEEDGEASKQFMAMAAISKSQRQQNRHRRYRLNVLVDNGEAQGAPVIYEDHPTYNNMVGRVEHLAQFGALMTDFNLIKPGSLHSANGGYLIIDARKVLTMPYAWEGLKRALHSSVIRIQSLEQLLSLVSTVSLEPEPIPLDVKIVLIGDRYLYYLLHSLDPDFPELFKVVADFDDDMVRSPENDCLYARMIATRIRDRGFRPFDRQAVARLIEHSSRLAGDAEKLSMQVRAIGELLAETDYWAQQAGREVAGEEDVQVAIKAQMVRSGRLRERSLEVITRGTVLIDTEGEVTGQINGLAVIQLGEFGFGRPSRITSRVRQGKGEIVDIERKVELGGALHSKGVLILTAFLAARFRPDNPISLWASLVFEQNYGGVDGDSASSAELYALLSALADVPIKQSLAVTGSVNQLGEVQAVGGVNEKIEGFFDLCKARGLNGQQGVLIPASNQKNLMLNHEVVAAVAEGLFHIYPVEHIDQGIEILTGIVAGKRTKRGNYTSGSINYKVEQRLELWAKAAEDQDRPKKAVVKSTTKRPKAGGKR